MKGQRDREGAAHNIAIAIRALPLPTPSLDALRDEVIEECALTAETVKTNGGNLVFIENEKERKAYVGGRTDAACRIRALKGAKR